MSAVPDQPFNSATHDADRQETREWMDALSAVIESEGPERAHFLLEQLLEHARQNSIDMPFSANTGYVNTIETDQEDRCPGNIEIEERLRAYMRWNAMAMVVKANRHHPVDGGDLGGHIGSFASLAHMFGAGFNHFWHAESAVPGKEHGGDCLYIQGHVSPGVYARAYLEGRLSEEQLLNFRQEVGGKGLSSYPHPKLMPEFWQFPTVSMGLGPLMAIYQARFLKYLHARGIANTENRKVWVFCGDGEMDEVESLGAIGLASRENLDNLIFVINCNLQRLDGPVRGNGKIIQELEAAFLGAGWNAIKVIWGSQWDELLAADKTGLLLKRMEEAVDGDYQKYSVEPGSYTRKHFFGKYPELLELVNHLTDEQIHKLLRGGHDPKKVYAAYKAAMDCKGQPTVIIAKTVKGYGLGEAGEGRNITHQQKKLNEKELREFRSRFGVPISDDEIAGAPFYRPALESRETQYLLERRAKLGGFLPRRVVTAEPLKVPALASFAEFFKGSGVAEASTTMGFVRLLSILLRQKEISRRIVPIIPDEARTFGLDALFREIGIYASKGQLYEPVDSKSLLYYREQKDGQILEEGITETGAMSSFIAAGTAYATHGQPMIPFYIYYSMFGYQRVGDLFWLAGDIKAKGFLLGATAGRTTLNGEGLQHQDGHTLLCTTAIPSLMVYDPAFAYETAVIIADGLDRMYVKGEELFYYLALYNENYPMPPMTAGVEAGILKGLYKFKPSPEKTKLPAQIFGSGSIINSALKAQAILAERYGVSADVWSATSYKALRSEAQACRRWNMLHPTEPARRSYVETLLENEKGPFIAVSDNVKLVPDQIAPWVPGGLLTLGTDGFGRSDTRARLRRFFEVDAESTVIATLYALAQKGQIKPAVVQRAIKELDVDPEKAFPLCL
jgi:pyruvate dehydrogenase E1 component